MRMPAATLFGSVMVSWPVNTTVLMLNMAVIVRRWLGGNDLCSERRSALSGVSVASWSSAPIRLSWW